MGLFAVKNHPAVTVKPIAFLAILAAGLSADGLYGDVIPSAEALLSRSIAHHDPDGRFLSGSWCLSFTETRPGSSDRRSEIAVDVPNERFRMVRRAEQEIAGR
ncbi:MAG: hypothetical protein AAGF23_26490, partial [Acidobacteriota bacterium]